MELFSSTPLVALGFAFVYCSWFIAQDIPSKWHKASAAVVFPVMVHTSLVLDIQSKWHKAIAATAGLSGAEVGGVWRVEELFSLFAGLVGQH